MMAHILKDKQYVADGHKFSEFACFCMLIKIFHALASLSWCATYLLLCLIVVFPGCIHLFKGGGGVGALT